MAPDPRRSLSTDPLLDEAKLGTVLGRRLRERRSELGKTLTEIARTVDMSPGYLSTIETGASVPSLPVLARLAHALDISLAETLRTSSSTHVSRGSITDDPGTRLLVPDNSQLEIACQSADAGQTGEAPVTLGNGDVFVYLHQGSLQITVDDETFELAPGDALHGDRPRQISWRATGPEPVLALWTTASTRTLPRS